MSRINQLLANYRRHIQLPLRTSVPAAQRIWFAVYPPEDERRLQHGIQEFELATTQAGWRWHLIDLHGQLSSWLKSVDPDEQGLWFSNPQDINLYARSEWRDLLSTFIRSSIASVAEPERTVVALTGLTELFDFLPVSDLLATLEGVSPGFLMLFFPGERENNTYRFMCARDGWDYLAVPIVSDR